MAVDLAVEEHLAELEGRQLRMRFLRCDPLEDVNGSKREQREDRVVVFVHGFPEIASSWVPQMRAVARQGWIAVAPDMPGYGGTGGPSQVERYSMENLTLDLAALLDHLKVRKAAFVSHDWGGSIAWGMALGRQNRCLGVAALNTPLSYHEMTGDQGPIEYFTNHPEVDAGVLDYQVYFNRLDGVPELELESDARRTIHAFYRKGSDLESMKVGMRVANVREKGILHKCPKDLARDPLWSEADSEEIVAAFQQTGFRRALNWYRNVDRNIKWMEPRMKPECIKFPCLMVTAEYDAVLSPETSAEMERFFAPGMLSRDHVVCGHWTNWEQPEKVNQTLVKWLETKVLPSMLSKL